MKASRTKQDKFRIGLCMAGGVVCMSVAILLQALRKTALTASAVGYAALTFVCLYGLFLAIVFFDRTVYRRENRRHRLCVCCAVGLSVLCMSGIFADLAQEMPLAVSYPCTRGTLDSGIYLQMFDAVKHGRLTLDVSFDREGFAALENPYDYNEREGTVGNSTMPFWDHAYYQGEMYSYFGIAPVFLFYFPFYFLSGGTALPTDVTACFFFGLLTLLAQTWLLWTILRELSIQIPLLLLCMGIPAMHAASLLFFLQSSSAFYYTPILCAITCLCAFFSLLLHGFSAKTRAKRIGFCAAAGVCFALCVASRPTFGLYALVAVPLFFRNLLYKQTGWREKTEQFASFFVPCLVGGALLMAYNAARFDNVLEFGSRYQLTVSDIRQNHLRLSWFGYALLHYLFAPLKINTVFPYVHLQFLAMKNYHAKIYLYLAAGSIHLPLTWGAYLPSLWNTRRRTANVCFACTIGCAIALMWVNLCLGGVHLRYAADFFPALALIGLLGFLLFCENGQNRAWDSAKCVLCIGLCMVTFYLGLTFALESEMNLLAEYQNTFYRFFAGF